MQDLAEFDFTGVDIALFSAGGSVSAEHAPRAGSKPDASSSTIHPIFAMKPDIPLVVPEVNPAALAEYSGRNIIANPNCSTIQMILALKPIYDVAGLTRINVATYQAVSGAGRGLVETLAGQTASLLNGRPADIDGDEKPIAFNAIPHIGDFQANGYTSEEMKMVWETRKISGRRLDSGESNSGQNSGVLRPLRGDPYRDPGENHGRAGSRSFAPGPRA